VVDGDTIDFKLDLGFHIYVVERVRLASIDTWELFSGDHRDKGQAAKDFVESQLNGATAIRVVCHTYDPRGKYGRVIGSVFYHQDKEFFGLAPMLRGHGHEKDETL